MPFCVADVSFFTLHHACVFPLWMVGVPAGVCVFVYVFVVFVCLFLCLFIIFVCFPLRMVGGSRLVVVFHRLFACNHQRLIAEGKLLANTAGSKQKVPQKRHRYQDTHGIRWRHRTKSFDIRWETKYLSSLSPGIEKFCPKFSVKYLFLSFLPPAIRWVPMIHRKLGLVIKAEISIPLLKIMRGTDVPGIQIFSPN